MVEEEGDFEADSLQPEGVMPLSKTGNTGRDRSSQAGVPCGTC